MARRGWPGGPGRRGCRVGRGGPGGRGDRVGAVAEMAESEGHHPDLQVGYGYCHVAWSTHAVEGLSNSDFICAAKCDQLM